MEKVRGEIASRLPEDELPEAEVTRAGLD